MVKIDSSSQDTRRRFEQWAKNPRCAANAASAILNIPMIKVAQAEGVATKFGQSPFALARGQSFERAMFKDNALVLRDELVSVGVLPTTARGFADFRFKRNGGPVTKIEHGRVATTAWMKDLAAGRFERTIAAGATIRIPGGVMLPHATLCIDAIAVVERDGRPSIIVGEIKVYPDRGGYTDATQLATSRAQAGMYVHALRLAIDEAKLGSRLTVESTGFLVLSRSGSNRISIRANEDFSGQAERAKTGLTTLSTVAQQLKLQPTAGLPVIQQAPVTYCESCVSFCERAERCRSEAERTGSGALLGDEAQRFLGDVTLRRVAQLADGAKPRDEHEHEIARLLAATEVRDGN